MKRKAPASLCPCGSGESLERCCGRFFDAGEEPSNALELMRSRYSAYVLGREEWLRHTWDPAHCPDGSLFDPSIRWLGLQIVRFEQIDQTHAIVEFVARGRSGGSGAFRLHEISDFERRDGRWIYTKGILK